MNLNLSNEACPHCWDEAVMRRPAPSATVHRDECAYCCRTCSSAWTGVYVCMACFTGLCDGHVSKHVSLNPAHTMYTCIRELPEERSAPEEETRDVYKLGVARPKVYESFLCCASCAARFDAVPELAVESYTGIVNSPVPGVKDDADNSTGFAKPQCPHLVCLEQSPSPFPAGTVPTSDDKCTVEGCVCCTNNWMCVTCGAIGCPREEAGGQGHALKHFLQTGHPVSVKLGTVTPAGADYYCYACDDDVDDVHFSAHMAHFGIDVATAKKTAKTMGEMQYDYTEQFDFNKITEAGSELTLLYGPGHTGIRNIGNSCYIASVVQCLMSIDAFRKTFYPANECVHQKTCAMDPYECRSCQTERLAAGLLSGDFSQEGKAQDGVLPRLFKKVFAQKHPEFSTGEQQDAQAYFLYLVEEMRRFVTPANSAAAGAGERIAHPCEVFELRTEQRLQCSNCKRVRYSCESERCLSLPIPVDPVATAPVEGEKLTDAQLDELRPRCALEACLEAAVQPNPIECRCEACGQDSTYWSTTRPRTFPDVLPVYLRRTYFDKQSLTTKKMDVYVDVPQELNLEAFRAAGLQEGEVEMPRSTAGGAGPGGGAGSKNVRQEAEVDELALATVMSMGIELNVAQYALRQTGMHVERAVDYIFSHPEIEVEMVAASAAPAGAAADSPHGEVAVGQSATAPTDGPGTYELTAMVSHIGSSAKVGHYVCHIKDSVTGKWVIFNDEKVGESQSPPFSMSSLLFYQRRA